MFRERTIELNGFMGLEELKAIYSSYTSPYQFLTSRKQIITAQL